MLTHCLSPMVFLDMTFVGYSCGIEILLGRRLNWTRGLCCCRPYPDCRAPSPFSPFHQRDDPEVLGHPDELSDIASAQFRHRACAMNFCGLLRDAELKCNLLIQLSLDNMEKNFVFAWRKPC